MKAIDNPNRHCFTHCPSCGRPDLFPQSDKAFACKACGFSFYLNCAAAAMALIMDDLGRLLVTIRKKEPAKGSYDLPGGFAEPGEGIEESLIREIKEELNLEITKLSYLCSFANTYPYNSVVYPITDIAFACKVKSLDTIEANDDISGFEFIDLKTIDLSCFKMESPKKVISYFKNSSSK